MIAGAVQLLPASIVAPKGRTCGASSHNRASYQPRMRTLSTNPCGMTAHLIQGPPLWLHGLGAVDLQRRASRAARPFRPQGAWIDVFYKKTLLMLAEFLLSQTWEMRQIRGSSDSLPIALLPLLPIVRYPR